MAWANKSTVRTPRPTVTLSTTNLRGHLSRTTQPVVWCCPRNEPAHCNQFSGKAEIERWSKFANLRAVRPLLEIWHDIWSGNLMDTTFFCLTLWRRTYVLPWSRVLLEKLTGSQLVKEFPAFYGTRRFITAFTMPHHLSLSWARSIQSTPPHPTSLRSILILSSYLLLGLPSGLLPSSFPTITLYTPHPSSIHATCPVHLILLDLITRTILGEE